ncbi:hypothetical protein [Streptomyces sp. NPDC059080]|uniref:hypothetical protein n=1 Tax=Streptomyces sp. NPDC059080 TaxID=3346718 RepID=UPI0036C8523A
MANISLMSTGRLFLAKGQQAWFGYYYQGPSTTHAFIRPSLTHTPFTGSHPYLKYTAEYAGYDHSTAPYTGWGVIATSEQDDSEFVFNIVAIS